MPEAHIQSGAPGARDKDATPPFHAHSLAAAAFCMGCTLCGACVDAETATRSTRRTVRDASDARKTVRQLLERTTPTNAGYSIRVQGTDAIIRAVRASRRSCGGQCDNAGREGVKAIGTGPLTGESFAVGSTRRPVVSE